MRVQLVTLVAFLCIVTGVCHCQKVVYVVSLPVSPSTTVFVQVGTEGTPTPLQSSFDGCLHSASISSDVTYSASPAYRFGVKGAGVIDWEPFWREPQECRIASQSVTVTTLQNEVFNQTESTLGLPPLPVLTGHDGEHLRISGVRPEPPPFIDDNQVVTFSIWSPQIFLDEVLLNPSDRGDTYVPINMTYVALGDHQFVTDIKMRRSGGSSISSYPYSFQVKMNKDNNLGGDARAFKLKSFAKDYPGSGGFGDGILLEKTSDDICTVLEAPINYMALARVYLNGEYYGIYGLLEKVDKHFAEARWPWSDTEEVGTLYKAHYTELFLTDSKGWVPLMRESLLEDAGYHDVCCACFDADCDVEDDCQVQDQNDPCYHLSCCDCPWEKNSDFFAKETNCETQQPYYDLVTLGDAIVSGSGISEILDIYGYLRSIACELAVLNIDGYVYHGFNYYWYRSSTDGMFHVITYDQDSSLSSTSFVRNKNATIYNWTQYEADALFLPTILEDEDALQFYNDILAALVNQFYRADRRGPLYERMRRLSAFLERYNPQREGLADRLHQSANTMTSASEKIQSQLGLSTLSEPVQQPLDICGSLSVSKKPPP